MKRPVKDYVIGLPSTKTNSSRDFLFIFSVVFLDKATLMSLTEKVVTETEQFSVKCLVLEAQPAVDRFTWKLNGVPIFTGEVRSLSDYVIGYVRSGQVFFSVVQFRI